MNLPKPEDLNAYVERLFGQDYTNTLRSLAKPVTPEFRQRLRDATPVSWIGEKEYEVIGHDCA